MPKKSSCASLVKRIQHRCFQDGCAIFFYHLKRIFVHLFISICLLILFQCFNRISNYWNGPFPMNLQQFQEHFKTNYNAHGYNVLFSYRPVLFQPEYLQVELGVGTIELKSVQAYSKYSHPPSGGILLQIFDEVEESTISKAKIRLYIRFSAHDLPYSGYRHPYRFRSFSIQTLRCIAKQIGILPKEFLSWSEKSIYVKTIEEIYDRNPRLFNEKVIQKCGILLGYLFYPWKEDIYKVDQHLGYQLEKNVRVFDAAWFYTAHGSHVFTILLITFLLIHIWVLFKIFLPSVTLSSKSLYICIENELKKLDGISFKDLDIILFETSSENNYHDNIFIINDGYLVILMIDFNENSPRILRQFSSESPFIIIDIETIRKVLPNSILTTNNGFNRSIYLKFDRKSSCQDRMVWLHTKLMILSNHYRHSYEIERKHRLNQLIEEEKKYQIDQYRYDFNRRYQQLIPASPHFIAEYRLNGPLTATNDLRFESCPVCFEDFQFDRSYTRWPCSAQHLFHFTCIIKVLRTSHNCPICRHSVQALDLSLIDSFL